ncbi:MAG: AAA family ATPase, partial [Mahellales bacterium]
ELWDKRNDIPTNFSKGMKQKVMIACSLVHDASVFLVDEPFMGLDPRASKLFKNILIRLKNNNKGILMATHILDTAEKLCDEYILLYKGSIRAMGTIEQLREASALGPHAPLEDIFIKLTEDRN